MPEEKKEGHFEMGHLTEMGPYNRPTTIEESIPFTASSNDVKFSGEGRNSLPANDGDDVECVAWGIHNRDKWDSKWEFLLSCVSMSVGLGNVWRFPVTAYENGGGAFLIPYFIVLFFIGRPTYFLELCLGQFASYSQVQVFKCAPLFKGVGYGMMVATFCILTYYCSILALSVYYCFISFRAILPWTECNSQDWIDGNDTCHGNLSLPELYFKKNVLREVENIDDGIGAPDWRLSICLVFSWVFIYVSIVKGVKWSGKVAYFTALFPYGVMIILLIRGLTLPGSWTGILYFIKPNWGKLLEPKVWYEAVTQCFYSLNTGTGSIIMFASFNKFRHPVYNDAIVVGVMDTVTSVLAGLVTFAILGNLAHELGVDVQNVVEGGTSLAFISYPAVIARMPWCPQLFAVLFFMMLFTLGVGSSTADAASIACVFCDRYPWMKRWAVTLVLCILGCGIGLLYVTPGGQWMLDLVDHFGGGFVIYLMSTLEIMGVAWVYGVYNFTHDVEFMLGMKLGRYWRFCWGFLVPVFLTLLLIYALSQGGSISHNQMAYPTLALVFGWLLASLALSTVPLGAAHTVAKTKGAHFLQKLQRSFTPRMGWGPRDLEERALWQESKATQDRRGFWQRLQEKDYKAL